METPGTGMKVRKGFLEHVEIVDSLGIVEMIKIQDMEDILEMMKMVEMQTL